MRRVNAKHCKPLLFMISKHSSIYGSANRISTTPSEDVHILKFEQSNVFIISGHFYHTALDVYQYFQQQGV